MASTNKTIPTTKKEATTWAGSWRNQYGSILKIIDEGTGRIGGSFSSAVDTKTKGQEIAVTGLYQDNLISFMLSGRIAYYCLLGPGLSMMGGWRRFGIWWVRERLTADTQNAPGKTETAGRLGGVHHGLGYF